MRPCLLAALLLVPAVAGCFGGVQTAPDSDFTGSATAQLLPEPVELEDGSVVSRNGTSAVLEWQGIIEAGAFATPVGNRRVTDAPAESATLRLPGSVPLRVRAHLTWVGSADLELALFDSEGFRCGSTFAAGSTFEAVRGEEACTVEWAEPRAADREWTVVVWAHDALVEDTLFQATVTVETVPLFPRYDLRDGPAGSTPVPDPAEPGPLESTASDYDFGVLLVEDRVTGRTYPVRVLGTVHFPTAGEGPYPVVIFMHGRHDACRADPPQGVPFNGGWTSHCRGTAPAAEAVASHRGYDDVAALLASHGYVVASIDANDINALDSPGYMGVGFRRGDDGLDARAQLILRTLDELRSVHEGAGVPANPQLAPLAGRLDLARLGLMGHSRGAEGVTRAPGLADETGHWSAGTYAAVYSLAGTRRFTLPDYQAPIVRAPTAYASVIPYCDGDVWTLGNTDLHDLYAARNDHGPLTQLVFMGANHNYYNAEWLDSDDADRWWNDPYCRPEGTEDGLGHGRLAPEDQRRHQRVYLSAFFRLYLGEESAFAPLFTGAATPPSSACPEGVASCPGLAHVSYHPPVAERRLVEDAASPGALEGNDLGGESSFQGFISAEWCDPFGHPGSSGDSGEESAEQPPCAWPRAVGMAPRLAFSWANDAVWRTTLPESESDLRPLDTLAFRVAVGSARDVAPGGIPPQVRVVLEDAAGSRAGVAVSEHSGALFAPPGISSHRLVLNQVRVPLEAFTGVELGQVRAIELQFDGGTPGAAQVAELMVLRMAPDVASGGAEAQGHGPSVFGDQSRSVRTGDLTEPGPVSS